MAQSAKQKKGYGLIPEPESKPMIKTAEAYNAGGSKFHESLMSGRQKAQEIGKDFGEVTKTFKRVDWLHPSRPLKEEK